MVINFRFGYPDCANLKRPNPINQTSNPFEAASSAPLNQTGAGGHVKLRGFVLPPLWRGLVVAYYASGRSSECGAAPLRNWVCASQFSLDTVF